MRGSTHLDIGIATAAVVNNNIKGVLIYLPFIILASLLPDIDCEKRSLIKNRKTISFFIICILGYIYFHQQNRFGQLGIALTVMVSYIYSKTKHRTISHSLLGMSILICCVSLISLTGAFWFTVGYVSHLFFDSITLCGVPLLYPFSKNNYGLRLVKSSGAVDKILRVFSICVILYFLIQK